MQHLVNKPEDDKLKISRRKQSTYFDVGMWKLGGEGAESLFKTSILFVPRPLTATRSPKA